MLSRVDSTYLPGESCSALAPHYQRKSITHLQPPVPVLALRFSLLALTMPYSLSYSHVSPFQCFVAPSDRAGVRFGNRFGLRFEPRAFLTSPKFGCKEKGG